MVKRLRDGEGMAEVDGVGGDIHKPRSGVKGGGSDGSGCGSGSGSIGSSASGGSGGSGSDSGKSSSNSGSSCHPNQINKNLSQKGFALCFIF